MRPDLAHIIDAIRRTRNVCYTVAVFLLVFGAPMTIGPHLMNESPTVVWAASGIGLLLLGTGARVLYMAWQMHDPANAPLSAMLRQRPSDISWVYVEQIDSYAVGVSVRKTHVIKVCTVAKRTLTLQVTGWRLDLVMASLRRWLPHATFGYDRQIHQRYKADPTALRSNATSWTIAPFPNRYVTRRLANR